MKKFSITSEHSFVTPVAVQRAIRTKFAFSKIEEVNVKYDQESKSFDVYKKEQYICSFEENGTEV
ncbi:MAG: hypothetical protein ACJARG_000039 [Arcticibacterium sp.]|jgi:hypothetical protein